MQWCAGRDGRGRVPAPVLPLATFPIIMRWFLIQMALNIGNVVQTEKVVHNYGEQVGMDAAVCLRLFWMSIQLFMFCSIPGQYP